MKKPKKEKLMVSGKELSIDSPLYAQFAGLSPRKGDLARARILSATLHCIANVGIAQAGFESIGKFAGMRRAHVAYYFPDLDGLVLSAIQFAISTAQQNTVAHVINATNDHERLQAYLHGSFDWASKYPEQVRVILLFYYYSGHRPEYREIHTKVREIGCERLATILKPLLKKSAADKVPAYAKLVQNILTGTLVEWATTRQEGSIEALEERTSTAIHLILGLRK
jgi:TetR/AcrR family transcriptional regulator, regulator of biofilm formation and stress response